MEYFRIRLANHVWKAISVESLDENYYKVNCHAEDFKRLPNGMVAYYKYTDDVEIPDIIERPTLMVTNKLMKIFLMYEADMERKSVKVFPYDRDINVSPEYWVLKYKEVQCLADYVKILPNGAIEELILRRSEIGKNEIFKVADTLENYIIVSNSVMESILRRQCYGVHFEKVRVE